MNEKMMASHDLLQMVQTLLKTEASKVTPAQIVEKIDLVISINPIWRELADRDWVVVELIRRFSVWSGKDATICNEEDHEKWLAPALKKDWKYWHRYCQWQEKRLPFKAVDALDYSTDHILGMLEYPERKGAWDRRGLVVGHVQSGKTGNYTGLICKAADAGYKIIIVLAGLHNNLRAQTQMRLDEGFLGYETGPSKDKLKIIGVGEIDRDPAIRPNYVTNRSEKGDFSIGLARNIGITPEARPWLFVVKKNKSVLESLLRWLQNHVADMKDPESGRPLVSKLPLLVIDDEADHASVDTGDQYFAEDGVPDGEHQPTTINRLIRSILHTFTRKAYVGYTATPFANIFIHEQGETALEGPDLFPSAFIVNLGAPSNYIGPARVFGLAGADGREGGLPVIRKVSDHCSEDGKSGWMPVSHKSSHHPGSVLPDSLQEAVESFFLACAIRKLRGQGNQHASMLVHVTRFNAVQKQVFDQISASVDAMRQRLVRRMDHEALLIRLENLWRNDFLPVRGVVGTYTGDLPEKKERWEDICLVLAEVAEEIVVRRINGTAKDALDYADSPIGLKVIAIGGDKLARGLTLEGLCTSYFLRASRMYDTLMQMGRWFGYRPQYLDVCRLYTTPDLVEWFEHIADAAEELREEFDAMVASGSTPRDFGLKVKSHPTLMVTSRLKMRSARSLYLSFSGSVVETVSFLNESSVVHSNNKAFLALERRLPEPSPIPKKKFGESERSWKGVIWTDIDWKEIVAFLEAYRTHPEAIKVNSRMLAEFVGIKAREGELVNWTVAVIGGNGEGEAVSVGSYKVPLIRRKPNNENVTDRYSIGRLLSPADETIDMGEPAWLVALDKTRKYWLQDNARAQVEKPDSPNGRFVREIKGFGAEGVPAHPEKGLLLLYFISQGDGKEPLLGFGISFPGSNSGARVEYKVNNVMWEQEYGIADQG